jgi:hypothetical protein
VIALLFLTVGAGCEARSSVDAAQTAVALTQTYLPAVQGSLPGTTVDFKVSPENADAASATDVAITATDADGTLGQMDARARQAATYAALLAAAQYYPHARISLTVVDGTGNAVIAATKPAGGQPSVQ